MYTHLVMWRLKDNANGMNKELLAKSVKAKLDSLPAIINEITHFEVGINIGRYGASFFDVGLISTFATESDFKTYCVNPEHDKIVAYIQSVTNDEQIVDF